MAYIEIIAGLNQGTLLRLRAETLIGRAPTNALCLPDKRASREHAAVRPVADGFAIEDLGSSNGTLVNGVLLQKRVAQLLKDGDEIVVCSTRMIYHANDAVLDGDPPARTPPQLVVAGPTQVIRKSSDSPSATPAPPPVATSQNRLEVIMKMMSGLAGTTDQKVLLDRLMDGLFQAFPMAHRTFVLLRDPRDGSLYPAIGRQRSDASEGGHFFAVSQTIIHAVIEKRQTVLSADAAGDFGKTDSIVDLSIHSMMCAPLICNDEILGLVHADITSSTERFTQEDLNLFTVIAAQVALAIKTTLLAARLDDIARMTGRTAPVPDPGLRQVETDNPKRTLKGG